MGFDVVDLARFDTRVVERFLQHRTLRRSAWCRYRACVTVVVYCGALNDSEDGVAVGTGVTEPLERNHSAALTLAESIGIGIKGLAATVRGQGCHLADADEVLGGQYQTHATGQCHITFARA